MNKLLMDAKKQFRGQTAKMDKGSYDNSPFVEGLYTLEIAEAKVREKEDKGGLVHPHFHLMLKVVGPENAGRNVWPYAPPVDTVDGVMAAAKVIRAVLGDVVPGSEDTDGQFDLDIPALLDELEDLTHQLIGEVVEARCVNQKPRADGRHMRTDGTPWQNWYINRGLGDDAKAAKKPEPKTTRTKRKAGASMAVGKKKGTRKKVVKRKR